MPHEARAAEAGLTFSDYMLRQLERSLAFPTIEELTRSIQSRDLARLETPPADLIRADRESH